ncbi:MAG: hypothetical protein EBU08_08885 [Micrococcales bacterium]|nr:hypothetical protein [Micrococcales bacterium]
MIDIYSKVEPGKLLHRVVRRADIVGERMDLVPPDQFIQCSALKLQEGKTYRPHAHIWKPGPEKVIAQESWCILSGIVRVTFYDLNDEVLQEEYLYAGDSSFTFEGGHTYQIMDDDTLVYEYKTGPYTGQVNDKRFIG